MQSDVSLGAVNSTNVRFSVVPPAPGQVEPELRFRHIRPSDRAALERAFEALSPNARYLRFHVPMRRLSDGLARYLTEVDGIDHVALIALDGAAPRGADGLGIARFVRNREAPDTAEAAITLADEAQGRGIATRLLRALASEARARGIHTFTMLVLSSNPRARRLLKRLGAVARSSSGDVISFELPVAALITNRSTRLSTELHSS